MTPLDATEYIWLTWVVTWFGAAVWSGRTLKRPPLRREVWYRLFIHHGGDERGSVPKGAYRVRKSNHVFNPSSMPGNRTHACGIFVLRKLASA
jgi:hypothetical protein